MATRNLVPTPEQLRQILAAAESLAAILRFPKPSGFSTAMAAQRLYQVFPCKPAPLMGRDCDVWACINWPVEVDQALMALLKVAKTILGRKPVNAPEGHTEALASCDQAMTVIREAIAQAEAKREPKSTGDGDDQPTGSDVQATVNDRMMAIFTRDKRCIGWSGAEWAGRLGVSKSAVTRTRAWQAILKERAARKAALQKAGFAK